MQRILFNKHERHSTGVGHMQCVHKRRTLTATTFLRTELSIIKILTLLNNPPSGGLFWHAVSSRTIQFDFGMIDDY
jgi:hypothetical protein